MDAPPPHESTTKFQVLGQILKDAGLSVPHVYAADHTNGFLLIEDFGDLPYRKALHQGMSEKLLYAETMGALVHLHAGVLPTSSNDNSLPTYTQELFVNNACLFLDWNDQSFSETAQTDFKDLWTEAYQNQPCLPSTLTLRDVMVDNLLWLAGRSGFQRCGFIDFQDGAWGPITYDLVSLLEDARRDVCPSFAQEMLDIYFEAFPALSRDDFFTSYYLWGAQRTTRILGVFVRQAKREGNTQYLAHVPRLKKILERDLQDPSLQPLRTWFQAYGGLR